MNEIKRLIDYRKWPQYGLFGFKILNYWQSILFSYIFILSEFLIVPFFGFEQKHVIAGALFILLINISIIILIFNSIIKIKRFNINLLILNTPLYIYIPFSLHKIFNQISFLKSIVS